MPASQPVAVAMASERERAARRRRSGSPTATDSALLNPQSAQVASKSGSAGQPPAALAQARGTKTARSGGGAASKLPPRGPAPARKGSAAADTQVTATAAAPVSHASQAAAVGASPPDRRPSQQHSAAVVGTADSQAAAVRSPLAHRDLSRAAARSPSDEGKAAELAGVAAEALARERPSPAPVSSAMAQVRQDVSQQDSAQPWEAHGTDGSSTSGRWLRYFPAAAAVVAAVVLAASSLALLSLAWRWRGPAGALSP